MLKLLINIMAANSYPAISGNVIMALKKMIL
jgi:hypothetical protein